MRILSFVCVLAATLFSLACGGDDPVVVDPTKIKFGDTALVVVVNPVVNDANNHTVPTPGTTRAGVDLETDDGLAATTDASGVAVLGPLTPGTRTVTVSGTNVGGSFTVTIATGELREIALATQGTTAQVMVEVDYRSDQTTEIVPTMTIAEVNAALAVSDTVVFVRGGQYVGDIDFSGSRVTLFGEGVLGGAVVLQGNVTVSGSNSRIRGTHITGDLSIPASGVGLTFSRVDGTTSSLGSDGLLLQNALCGADTITGSGSIVLGNAGASPITQCP